MRGWVAPCLLVFVLTLVAILSLQASEVKPPRPVPEEAKARPNPVAADRVSIAEGREMFQSQCTMCHGVEGRGDGDLVERLGLQVPDFTVSEWQQAWTDGAMFWVLSEGHGRMPAQKGRKGEQRFSEEQRWQLVNYVRSLGPS